MLVRWHYMDPWRQDRACPRPRGEMPGAWARVPSAAYRDPAARRSRPWPLSALPPRCLRPQLPRLCAGAPSGHKHLHPPPATYTSRPLRPLQPPSITPRLPSTAEPDPHGPRQMDGAPHPSKGHALLQSDQLAQARGHPEPTAQQEAPAAAPRGPRGSVCPKTSVKYRFPCPGPPAQSEPALRTGRGPGSRGQQGSSQSAHTPDSTARGPWRLLTPDP